MFEKFIQNLRRAKELEPEDLEVFDSKIDHTPDRNFDIEIQEQGEEITLKLNHNNGDVYDLDDTLPDGDCFFVLAEKEDGIFAHEFSPENNTSHIEIQKGQITRRDFLLNVFHEIGHAQQSRNPESPIGKTYTQKGLLEASVEQLSKNNLTEEEQKVFNKLDENLSSQEMLLERNAWAWALTELRYLEEQGYDVLSGFGKKKLQGDGTYRRESPRKEIMEYINECLGSYERE